MTIKCPHFTPNICTNCVRFSKVRVSGRRRARWHHQSDRRDSLVLRFGGPNACQVPCALSHDQRTVLTSLCGYDRVQHSRGCASGSRVPLWQPSPAEKSVQRILDSSLEVDDTESSPRCQRMAHGRISAGIFRIHPPVCVGAEKVCACRAITVWAPKRSPL